MKRCLIFVFLVLLPFTAFGGNVQCNRTVNCSEIPGATCRDECEPDEKSLQYYTYKDGEEIKAVCTACSSGKCCKKIEKIPPKKVYDVSDGRLIRVTVRDQNTLSIGGYQILLGAFGLFAALISLISHKFEHKMSVYKIVSLAWFTMMICLFIVEVSTRQTYCIYFLSTYTPLFSFLFVFWFLVSVIFKFIKSSIEV